MAKMKAAKFISEGVMKIQEVDIPKVKKGNDILVKILAASVCGSDLAILSVPQKHPADFGVTIGHECVAEVYDIGNEVKTFKKGDRVAVDPIIPCGNCAGCKSGHYNMCSNLTAIGVQVDGVFAEYCLVTEDKLHRLPNDLAVEKAIFIEPVACVMNGFKRLNLLPGQSVVVLGAGPIGLYFSKICKAAGAGSVIITEMMDFRIDFAKENSDADYVIDTKAEDLKAKVYEILNGGADIVVDTVGVLFPQAIECVKNEGKILLFGINDRAQQTIRQYDIVHKEITVVASYATHNTFPMVIEMLSKNVVNLDSLLTHKYPLEKLQEAVDVAREGKGVEVVVYP